MWDAEVVRLPGHSEDRQGSQERAERFDPAHLQDFFNTVDEVQQEKVCISLLAADAEVAKAKAAAREAMILEDAAWIRKREKKLGLYDKAEDGNERDTDSEREDNGE